MDILYCKSIVAYRTVAKRRLCKQRPFLGQRPGKHVPAATNTYVIIELLLETGCFLWCYIMWTLFMWVGIVIAVQTDNEHWNEYQRVHKSLDQIDNDFFLKNISILYRFLKSCKSFRSRKAKHITNKVLPCSPQRTLLHKVN
jgi:hypothetical protein